LPPVVFVGMRRAVSKSGTVSLYPSDLCHIACALLVPIRVYGYQKVSQGTGVGGIWVYVDMVCGSCGAVVSLSWQVSDGLWTRIPSSSRLTSRVPSALFGGSSTVSR